MAYFYVKSGGTATGDSGRYASQQTGSFATIGLSGYYDNVVAACAATTAPTHADYVCVSDQHSHNYSSDSIYAGVTTSVGAGVVFMSVDDNACDTYKRGAAESATISSDISLQGHLIAMGFDWIPGDNLQVRGEEDVTLYDCTSTVTAGGSDQPLRIWGDGCYTLISCTINSDNSGNDFFEFTGSHSFKAINCTFTSAGAVYTKDAIQLGTATTSQALEFDGCDFSGLGSSNMVLGSGWDGLAEYPKRVTFKNCKIPSGASWVTNSPAGRYSGLLAVNSSDTSAAAEYQYYFENGLGVAEDETGIYRDGSTAYPSGQKVSLKVVSDTNASVARPFSFEMPTRPAELSNTATDTIRLYFMCANALDDGDVWAEVIYPDGTNKHTPNYKLSVTDAFDPFRSAGSLATNTEAWTGRTTENRYQIDLDTSGDPGADGVPIIRVYVAKASETIYFCTDVDLGAG